MSNTVHVQRNAIEEAVRHSIKGNNQPLRQMTKDPEFHINGKEPARIAGISLGRGTMSEKPEENASVLVLTHCNGTRKNGLDVRKRINEIRAAQACVILKDKAFVRGRVFVKGRIVEVHTDGPPVRFIPLVTNTSH